MKHTYGKTQEVVDVEIEVPDDEPTSGAVAVRGLHAGIVNYNGEEWFFDSNGDEPVRITENVVSTTLEGLAKEIAEELGIGD